MEKNILKYLLIGSLGIIGLITLIVNGRDSLLPFIMFFSFYSNITWNYIQHNLKSIDPQLIVKTKDVLAYSLLLTIIIILKAMGQQVPLRTIIILTSMAVVIIFNVIPVYYIYLTKRQT